MKVVYCIAATYLAGGMERVLALKANYLSEHGYNVTIITTNQKQRPSFYSMNQHIHHYDLGINYDDNRHRFIVFKIFHFFLNRFKHRIRLAKLLKTIKADIVVSMFGNEMPHLIKIKDGSKKVLEFHNSWQLFIMNRRKGILKLFDIIQEKVILKRVKLFDRFILLTKEDQQCWRSLGIENTSVIYNPRTFQPIGLASLDSKKVIAIGRLDKEKGFDRLIELWGRIHQVCPEWILHIYGEGPLRDYLQVLIDKKNVNDTIVLKGLTNDIQKVISGYSMLVMTSIYEGLPMVLLEAQTLGLPILAYSFPCGPNDVITSGVDGYVVTNGDQDQFVNMAIKLMSDDILRKEMGRSAYYNSSRFAIDVIMDQWQSLFNSLI